MGLKKKNCTIICKVALETAEIDLNIIGTLALFSLLSTLTFLPVK